MSSSPIAIPKKTSASQSPSTDYHYEIDAVTSNRLHNDNLNGELDVKHHLFDPNNSTPPNPWLKKLTERIERYDSTTLST